MILNKELSAFLRKEIPTHTLEAYTGSGRIAPLNTWWREAVNFMAQNPSP